MVPKLLGVGVALDCLPDRDLLLRLSISAQSFLRLSVILPLRAPAFSQLTLARWLMQQWR